MKTIALQPVHEAPRASRLQRLLDRYVSPALSRVLWTAQLAQDEFPGILAIEVTSMCNLRCPMCPRTFSDRKFGHMTLETIKRLIDEVEPYDRRGLVEQVALQEYGEIFLHPDWFEIIEYACARLTPSKIRLDTNGTMMRPPVVDRLFESRLPSLIVSVDGVDETSYDILRAGGRFANVVANLEYLIAQRRQAPDKGPAISIQVIESDLTRDYLAAFTEQWRQKIGDARRIEVSVIPYHDFGGQIDDPRFATRRRDGLHVNLPCYRLTYELDVHSDGVVTACCLDSERTIAVGNIHEQSLVGIWGGAALRRFREEMRRAEYGRLPLCESCPHSRKFIRNYASGDGLARLWTQVKQSGRRLRSRRLFS
jgi:MoaA/NifB/PqqE/SkfB family radical SAM enzyme